MTVWNQRNFTTRPPPAGPLLPITSHRRMQEAHLLLEALARLAPDQMQPDTQIQREGDIPVLHLRNCMARGLTLTQSAHKRRTASGRASRTACANQFCSRHWRSAILARYRMTQRLVDVIDSSLQISSLSSSMP